MNIKNKIVSTADKVKTYWKTPPLGNYMNFKEITAYSVGGIGVYALLCIANYVIVSGSNFVLINATGLAIKDLLIIYYISFFFGLGFIGIRAKLIDGMRSKKGKYRPYILVTGIPLAIVCIAMVYTPYNLMPKIAVYGFVLFYNLILQFFYGFFSEAYENLIFVLSPNTTERSDVTAFKSVVYSIAPTIINPLIPLIKDWTGSDDVYDIKIYKVLFPVTAVLGVALSVIVYVYTKEKIVQARTHIIEIRFMDAVKAVAKNKYFWIISLAGWLGFLEGAYGYILTWLWNYGHYCTDGQYSLITLIYGDAWTWGMIAAPFAIRRWGKKNVLITTNMLNILFIALMWPSLSADRGAVIWLILICLYINALMTSFSMILSPSINADIRDYQHYITGERIDGMFGAVGVFTSFIGLATGTVIPAIFSSYGINDHNGYKVSTDILMDEPDIMMKLIKLLIVLATFGATMNVLPYFFYDLTENKQRGIVKVLKIRALFEDYGNNALRDAELVQAIDIVNESRENYNKQPVPVSKAGLFAPKPAKKQRKSEVEYNRLIETSRFVVDEMDKFDTELVQTQVSVAKGVYSAGLEGILHYDDGALAAARTLSTQTKDEKDLRKVSVESAKAQKRSKKAALKVYPNGVVPFDRGIFDTLFAEEDAIDEALDQKIKALAEAKTLSDAAGADALKTEIRALRAKNDALKKEIKKATDANSRFNASAKAYLDAKKLLTQQENYSRFDEIAALYDDAKARAEAAAEKEAEEKQMKEEAEKEFAKKLKEEKAAKRRK